MNTHEKNDLLTGQKVLRTNYTIPRVPDHWVHNENYKFDINKEFPLQPGLPVGPGYPGGPDGPYPQVPGGPGGP